MDGSIRFWQGRITVLVPELLHAIEPKAEIVPVVGTDVVLVEFVEQRLEVTQAADRTVSGMVAAGGILANTPEQDGPLDPFEGEALLEPAAGQDFVGGGKDSLDARPGLEEFFQGRNKRLGGGVRFFRFGFPVRPEGCGNFDAAAAGRTAAEVTVTDASGFHLTQVGANAGGAFAKAASQLGLGGFQLSGIATGIEAEIDEEFESTVGK